jgi:DNA primase catalytic subunit
MNAIKEEVVQNNTAQSQSDIEVYYKLVFPYELIWKLFVRSEHREVALSCEYKSREFYKRFQSTPTHLAFANTVTQKNVKAVHIGAFYDNERNMNPSYFCGKELVFDLDLNDNPARSICCGKEKKCCEKCWIFAEAAMEIIEFFMTQVYGICESQIVHVFSGSKGFHTWILDPCFFNLNDIGRGNVLDHMLLNNTQQDVKDAVYAICKKYYDQFKEEDYAKEFCRLFIRDTTLRVDIEHFFLPKFDQAVTKSKIHLTKIPLAMHPSSKKIATIINKETKQPMTLEESIEFLENLCTDKNIINFMKQCNGL